MLEVLLRVMVAVSEPSSHRTQFPTAVGANGAVYDIFTVFTLEMVLLHMFSTAFTTSVLPSKVKLEFANAVLAVPVAVST